MIGKIEKVVKNIEKRVREAIARRSLPIRLPFIWWARTRWLQVPGEDKWEILIRWKYDGQDYFTWVVYCPGARAMWTEDTDCYPLRIDLRVCDSTEDLYQYILWVSEGKPE